MTHFLTQWQLRYPKTRHFWRHYYSTCLVQCVAVCCSVLQCVAVATEVPEDAAFLAPLLLHVPGKVCCSVLQCVAVCCSVLQWQLRYPKTRHLWRRFYSTCLVKCVAVCCSVLQCVAVATEVPEDAAYLAPLLSTCLVQCVAVCCIALQCVAVRCSVLHRTAVCCSALQCNAVCCSVVQYVAHSGHASTVWRRLIGCLKLQVFRKRATNYRALLRKMTCTDKATYGSSPPCTGDMAFLAPLQLLVSGVCCSVLRCAAVCCSVL